MFSKQNSLKGCHKGQILTVLAILRPLEFKNLSCLTTMVRKKQEKQEEQKEEQL